MKPSRTFVVSDMHLFHKLMLSMRKPDYQDTLLSAMRQLRETDTLINLGDVIFGQEDELKGLMESIPCRHVLVRGNHDRHTCNWYMSRGFDYCADGVSLKYDQELILFTHRPQEDLGAHTINIHGHLHDKGHRSDEVEGGWWDNGGRHRLFSLERLGVPVELSKFLHLTKKE